MNNMMKQYSPKEIAAFDGLFALVKDGKQFSDIKVQDIATAAGIGKGTLYEYFSSKEDILSSAIYFALDGMFCRFEQVIDESMSFRQIVEHFLAEMDDDVPIEALAGLIATISKEQREFIKDQGKEKIKELFVHIKCVEERAFSVGRKTGEISPELDDSFCEYVILSALFGQLATHIFAEKQNPCTINRETTVEMICRTLRP